MRCGPFPQDASSLEKEDLISETEMEKSGKRLAGSTCGDGQTQNFAEM